MIVSPDTILKEASGYLVILDNKEDKKKIYHLRNLFFVSDHTKLMDKIKKTEIEYLLEDVEKLRKNLHELIILKGSNLQDSEVIAASQALNAAITKYNEMIRKHISSDDLQ